MPLAAPVTSATRPAIDLLSFVMRLMNVTIVHFGSDSGDRQDPDLASERLRNRESTRGLVYTIVILGLDGVLCRSHLA